MSTGIVYGYLEHYKGNCIVVIHDRTCTVQPTTVADILKADRPESEWTTVSTQPASTVGRACELTVFARGQAPR